MSGDLYIIIKVGAYALAADGPEYVVLRDDIEVYRDGHKLRAEQWMRDALSSDAA